MKQGYDVVVAGAGNAAFCVALAARERVGRVLMLEKAPPAWIGGNTYFTAGAFRTTFSDVEDLSPILDDVAEEQLARTELPPYTEDDFVADMNRVTEDCCDDELTNILASEAADAVRWLHGKGIRWRLMYDRQSFEVGGKRSFWGAGPRNGGRRQRARTTAPRRGYQERYRSSVRARGDQIVAERLRYRYGGGMRWAGGSGGDRSGCRRARVRGFEANARMREGYLGPDWGAAKVRGTPYNTGEGLQAALDSGAQPYGDWGGCHAIAWDAAAPPTGDRELTNLFSKQSYPMGIVVAGGPTQAGQIQPREDQGEPGGAYKGSGDKDREGP